jgi:hypothetical protein
MMIEDYEWEILQEEQHADRENIIEEDYIEDDGKHHVGDCKECPECGEMKFWYLERVGVDLCVDCANIYDNMFEK